MAVTSCDLVVLVFVLTWCYWAHVAVHGVVCTRFVFDRYTLLVYVDIGW